MPSSLYATPLNDRPFSHRHEQIDIFCERCDFKTPVYVVVPDGPALNPVTLMAATGCVMGYHAVNIRPELNGFAGYDAIRYELITEQDAKALKKSFGLR